MKTKKIKRKINKLFSKKRKEIILILSTIIGLSVIGFYGQKVNGEFQQSDSNYNFVQSREDRVKSESEERINNNHKELEGDEIKEWVLNEWEKVGQRDNANSIITCESKWNNNTFNINTNNTVDLGLYEWNTIHLKSGLITLECIGNYKCSTFKAIEMWKKNGWKPWVCARLLNIK